MKTYRFESKLWIWKGAESGAWHFITVPKALSSELKEQIAKTKVRRGFGSWKVRVTIGKTSWDTSIFPTKDGVYLLPVKASVRKKEGIFADDRVPVSLALLDTKR